MDSLPAYWKYSQGWTSNQTPVDHLSSPLQLKGTLAQSLHSHSTVTPQSLHSHSTLHQECRRQDWQDKSTDHFTVFSIFFPGFTRFARTVCRHLSQLQDLPSAPGQYVPFVRQCRVSAPTQGLAPGTTFPTSRCLALAPLAHLAPGSQLDHTKMAQLFPCQKRCKRLLHVEEWFQASCFILFRWSFLSPTFSYTYVDYVVGEMGLSSVSNTMHCICVFRTSNIFLMSFKAGWRFPSRWDSALFFGCFNIVWTLVVSQLGVPSDFNVGMFKGNLICLVVESVTCSLTCSLHSITLFEISTVLVTGPSLRGASVLSMPVRSLLWHAWQYCLHPAIR